MESKKKVTEKKKVPEFLEGFEAKKDHVIFQNDFRADIKKGDDLKKVPFRFKQVLEAEGVL